MAIRVIPVGDVAAATPYWGMAKKFGRQVRASGLRTKTIRYGDVQFRVEHYPESMTTKVFITAGDVRGYQFYTTSPNVQWVSNAFTEFSPGGSSIYVPTPKADVGAMIAAYPIHSLVDVPPVVDGAAVWAYTPMPTAFADLQALMSGPMFKAKGGWQMDGVPEYTYYVTHDTPAGCVIDVSLLTAWVEPGGTVFGHGSLAPIGYRAMGDRLYDVAPGKIPHGGVIRMQMPDGDWPERACIQVVSGRMFIILHTADDQWHCWPLLSNDDLDQTLLEVASPVWLAQAYKANVNSAHARSVSPAYPSWVFQKGGQERNHADQPRMEPRYRFSFNRAGTRGIAAMVERKEFTGTYSKVNYAVTPITTYINPPWDVPQEIITTDPVRTDQTYRFFGIPTDDTPMYEDRMGVVELGFSIEITGNELGDFTFSVAVVDQKAPGDVEALGKGMLVEVAYAMPLDWSRIATVGALLPADSAMRNVGGSPPVQPDDVLSCWTTLYRHADQDKVDEAFDGVVAVNIPSKSKASFYRGPLGAGMTLLFELPLSQVHGAGHTTDPITLPDNSVVSPPTPHEFIQQTSYTANARYPFILGTVEGFVYFYDATITHLELSSLAFYYTARIVQQRRDDTPLNNGEGRFTFVHHYRTGEVVWPFVFGRAVMQKYRGAQDRPFKEWLEGWASKSCATWPDGGESVLPMRLQKTIRGITRETSSTAGFWDHGLLPSPADSYINWSGLLSSPVNFINEDNLGSVSPTPWWFTGPCHDTCKEVIRIAVQQHYFPGAWYANTGVHQNLAPVGIPSIMTYTEATIDNLLDIIATFYDTYYAQSLVVVSETTTEWRSAYPWQLRYSANPFVPANPSFTGTGWVESAKYVLWQSVQRIQTAISLGLYGPPEYGEGRMFYNVIPRGGSRLLTPVGGEFLSADFSRFKLPDGADPKRDAYLVRNFDWGLHAYNNHRLRHFASPAMDLRARILTTPEGHYSFSLRSHYSFTGEYPALNVVYYSYITALPADREAHPELEIPFAAYPNTGYTLNNEDFDWGVVDQVGWHYGLVHSDHLSLYNLAYDRHRGTDSAKRTLSNGERFTAFYPESAFSPQMEFTYVGAEPSVVPGLKKDGMNFSIQHCFLPLVDNIGWSAAGIGFIPDYSTHKHVRLSPLFF